MVCLLCLCSLFLSVLCDNPTNYSSNANSNSAKSQKWMGESDASSLESKIHIVIAPDDHDHHHVLDLNNSTPSASPIMPKPNRDDPLVTAATTTDSFLVVTSQSDSNDSPPDSSMLQDDPSSSRASLLANITNFPLPPGVTLESIFELPDSVTSQLNSIVNELIKNDTSENGDQSSHLFRRGRQTHDAYIKRILSAVSADAHNSNRYVNMMTNAKKQTRFPIVRPASQQHSHQHAQQAFTELGLPKAIAHEYIDGVNPPRFPGLKHHRHRASTADPSKMDWQKNDKRRLIPVNKSKVKYSSLSRPPVPGSMANNYHYHPTPVPSPANNQTSIVFTKVVGQTILFDDGSSSWSGEDTKDYSNQVNKTSSPSVPLLPAISVNSNANPQVLSNDFSLNNRKPIVRKTNQAQSSTRPTKQVHKQHKLSNKPSTSTPDQQSTNNMKLGKCACQKKTRSE